MGLNVKGVDASDAGFVIACFDKHYRLKSLSKEGKVSLTYKFGQKVGG